MVAARSSRRSQAPASRFMMATRKFNSRAVRRSHPFAVGNVRERGLAGIWTDPPYVELRRRVRAFDFSPCASCNTCELADDNLRDCSGSPLPACGGCLWAQGLVQCP